MIILLKRATKNQTIHVFKCKEMEIIVMAAILDFNRKWIFFRLPSYLKLKILLKTMFVPNFLLVPQKAVFFDIWQLSAGLISFCSDSKHLVSRSVRMVNPQLVS